MDLAACPGDFLLLSGTLTYLGTSLEGYTEDTFFKSRIVSRIASGRIVVEPCRTYLLPENQIMFCRPPPSTIEFGLDLDTLRYLGRLRRSPVSDQRSGLSQGRCQNDIVRTSRYGTSLEPCWVLEWNNQNRDSVLLTNSFQTTSKPESN